MANRNSFITGLVLSILAGIAYAAESSSTAPTSEFETDPYLQFRPVFARSLPVQILLTGVVLTLTAVLFIHLMFTAQYHWPLAPVNYVLQLSGVTTLLISLVATIHVVLSATMAQSERWPYMLDYIAVNVPPPLDTDVSVRSWSMAERATWLVMNASVSGLIQITHIQFLTLLYPSRLEGRLIFAMLGPLAVVAAVMQLVPISDIVAINIAASAVRNVCNATLSLLFTVALFIWGILINRKQAWRTDGGTAAFGAGALTLAFVSTALNFIYVQREDEFVWLPGLMWAVILWQSFLGWWWWVGAGSGAGLASEDEIEDRLEREARRKKRKKEAREQKQETKSKAKKVWDDMTGSLKLGRSSGTGSSRMSEDAQSQSNVRSRRGRAQRRSPSTDDEEETTGPPSPNPSVVSTFSTNSAITSTTLPRGLPGFVHTWYSSVRQEHLAAARRQAAERIERIRELERNGTQRAPRSGSGWGLGSFGWIVPAPSHTRSNSNARHARDDHDSRSRSPSRSRSRSRSRIRRPRRGHDDIELAEIGRVGSVSSAETIVAPTHSETNETSQLSSSSRTGTDGLQTPPIPRNSQRGALRITIPDSPDRAKRLTVAPSPQSPTPATPRPRSVWWWGPLWRWRLQDSTSYS